MKPLFAILLLSIACPNVFSQEADESKIDAETETSPQEPDSIETLIEDLEEILKKDGVPGAGIAIVSKDQDIWVGGLGLANIETERPADENTLFRIGSISKMFVSLAALQLQEEGVLDLEDTLLEHAPEIEFKNRWSETHPIRIAHLLEHSTGFDDLHFNEYALAEPTISLKDAYAFNPRSRQSRWRPGDFATYSNANPPLAAYVVEKLKQQSFEDYVQTALFDPLEMNTSSYFLTPEVEKLLATGYEGSKKNPKTVDYWHIIMRPSGSINSSAREMSNLLSLFLNRGVYKQKRLLSEASIERMETPLTTLAARHGLYDGYGLNNYTKTYNGWVWQGHNGGMMGYVADLTYQPELGVGFVIMINRASGALDKLNKRISNFLLQEVETPELPADIELSESDIEKYAGYYRKATTRNQFSYGMERLPFQVVEPGDGHFNLTVIPGGSTTLIPVEGGLYRHGKKWMATNAFFEDEDGKAHLQRGAFGTFEKVSAFSAWSQFLLAILCVLLMLSSLVLLPVYGLGRVVGKFKDVADWGLRLMPPLAVLSLVASMALSAYIVSSNTRLFEHFGNPTVLSVSIYLLQWAFAILAMWGLVKAIRSFFTGAQINRFMRIYLLCISAACVMNFLYDLYWNPWIPVWMY